jgi:hypothetical protein
MSASVPQLRRIARPHDMDKGQLNWTASLIWVLSNPKSACRNGKAQLIDAPKWFKPLHKYLGNMRGGS